MKRFFVFVPGHKALLAKSYEANKTKLTSYKMTTFPVTRLINAYRDHYEPIEVIALIPDGKSYYAASNLDRLVRDVSTDRYVKVLKSPVSNDISEAVNQISGIIGPGDEVYVDVSAASQPQALAMYLALNRVFSNVRGCIPGRVISYSHNGSGDRVIQDITEYVIPKSAYGNGRLEPVTPHRDVDPYAALAAGIIKAFTDTRR